MNISNELEQIESKLKEIINQVKKMDIVDYNASLNLNSIEKRIDLLRELLDFRN